ncbi:OTU domain containing protein [Pelomyxa schiedti]|nr:OTU domain containing protein [Pelomyxa schiedti]
MQGRSGTATTTTTPATVTTRSASERGTVVDKFGDVVATGPGQPLTVAQTAARESREFGCRWLKDNVGAKGVFFDKAPAHVEFVLIQGVVRVTSNMIVASYLAAENLQDMIVIKYMINESSRMLRVFQGKSTPRDLSQISEDVGYLSTLFSVMSTPNVNIDTAAPYIILLCTKAVLSIAEEYFSDKDRHFVTCMKYIEEKVSLCLRSPNERRSCLEVLGRAQLLRGRHSIYSGTDASGEVTLGHARISLTDAIRLPAARGYSTAMYDLARACALLGDADEAKIWLDRAKNSNELPAAGIMRAEPDFSPIRDAQWFRDLVKEALAAETAGANMGLELLCTSRFGVGRGCGTAVDLKSSMIEHGFEVRKIYDFLKFSLYMGKPSGPDVGPDDYEKTIAAKERLKERMMLFGVREKRVIPGDGNCQFYALCDQLYDDINRAAELREETVNWLLQHRDWDTGNGALLRDFVHNQTWEEYCATMKKNGIWGDNLTLVAVSEMKGVSITILSSVSGDNFFTEIVPHNPQSEKVCLLSHFAEFHYGSLERA